MNSCDCGRIQIHRKNWSSARQRPSDRIFNRKYDSEDNAMTKILHGVIHGRIIELDGDAGFEDGRTVEVVVRTKTLPGPPPGWKPGSAETAAGMMSDCWTDEDDRILNEIYQERKKSGRRENNE